MRIENHIDIKAKPEYVWRYIADPEKWLEFHPMLAKVEYVSEKHQGPGAVFKTTWKDIHGHERTEEEKFVEWVENKKLSWIATDGNNKQNKIECTLAPLDGKDGMIRVTFSEESRDFDKPNVRNYAQGITDAVLSNLQKTIEKNSGSTSAS